MAQLQVLLGQKAQKTEGQVTPKTSVPFSPDALIIFFNRAVNNIQPPNLEKLGLPKFPEIPIMTHQVPSGFEGRNIDQEVKDLQDREQSEEQEPQAEIKPETKHIKGFSKDSKNRKKVIA